MPPNPPKPRCAHCGKSGMQWNLVAVTTPSSPAPAPPPLPWIDEAKSSCGFLLVMCGECGAVVGAINAPGQR